MTMRLHFVLFILLASVLGTGCFFEEATQVKELAEQIQEVAEKVETGNSLEQRLLDDEIISPEGLERANAICEQASLGLEQALLESKALNLEALGKQYEKQFSIPWIDLKTIKLDQTIVKIVPDTLMREARLMAFRKRGKTLDVAMTDPRDQSTVDRLQMLTGMKIQPYLADLRALAPVLRKFVPDYSEGKGRIAEIASLSIEKAAEEESAVEVINKVIEGAVNSRATDIHLDPQDDHLRVRYRIDGLLYDIMTVPAELMVPATARVKAMAEMDITERRRPQDGHLAYTLSEQRFDLRISTLPTRLGEKLVMRLLDDTTVLKGMRQLGFGEADLHRVEELVKRPYGMFLVTGPIGSGKTTTLYAALSEVNQPKRNIITIEDPIEYQLPGINQVQVDLGIDLSFADGLRGILRQDADILMVGEIRDPETAKTAVRAAMTGHLLFSTLHTNYSVNAITALRHLGIQPFLIAGSVNCVIAQRLLRRVCPHCAESFVPPTGARDELGLPKSSRKQIKRAVGCAECYHTGYMGRTGVYEVLVMDERIKEQVVENGSEAEILATATTAGMTTIAENGKAKVIAGETTLDELLRVIYV